MSSPIVIRRLLPDEGLRLRELRLSALAGAPEAFAETLAEVQLRPESHWHELSECAGQSDERATFVAVEAERFVGTASIFLTPEHRETAHLVAMWVETASRRRGLGRALITETLSWASGQGCREVVLWVSHANAEAQALYRAMGFSESGKTQPLRSHPSITERLMRRDLRE